MLKTGSLCAIQKVDGSVLLWSMRGRIEAGEIV